MFRQLLRVLIVVATTALLVHGVSAEQAAAHASLESSVPADGEVLIDVPETLDVTLTFTGDVQAEFAQVAVTGPDGESMTSEPVVVDGAGVRQPVRLSAEGAYVVAYRVISSDGHPVSGQLAFTVHNQDAGSADGGTSGQASQSAASPEPTTTTAAVNPAAHDDSDSESGSWWSVLAVGGALVALGLGALELIRRRRTDG